MEEKEIAKASLGCGEIITFQGRADLNARQTTSQPVKRQYLHKFNHPALSLSLAPDLPLASIGSQTTTMESIRLALISTMTFARTPCLLVCTYIIHKGPLDQTLAVALPNKATEMGELSGLYANAYTDAFNFWHGAY